METIEYNVNDVVEMKKEHPCASRCKQFKIIRVGADIKIQCLGCGSILMLNRHSFEKNLKKIISKG